MRDFNIRAHKIDTHAVILLLGVLMLMFLLGACKPADVQGKSSSASVTVKMGPAPDAPAAATPLPETTNPQPTLGHDHKEFICGSNLAYLSNSEAFPYRIYGSMGDGTAGNYIFLVDLTLQGAFTSIEPPGWLNWQTNTWVKMPDGSQRNVHLSIFADFHIECTDN